MANDASYPGGLTYDDWIQYWKCDKAPWISEKLTIDDVVGDVRFAAREIARLTERLEAAEELRCELRLCAHCMEVTECYVHAMADVIVWVCSKCQNDADTEFRDYEEDVR